MINGIINIYKEAGFTSHDVVAKIRGICKQKKIGHTGTLDPDATGVLPVCLGSGTKLCEMLTDKSKEYEAVMLLGMETDTQDASGNILQKTIVNVNVEEVERVIYSFLGEYEQIPPMYSALKVNGKKLYELAREGITIERQPRRVNIENIKVTSIHLPEVVFTVECSKGTYIRTLCHDIGQILGCGGIMKSLKRTRVGMFEIDSAITLSELEQLRNEDRILENVMPVDEVFKKYPQGIVKQEFLKLADNGNSLYTQQVFVEEKISNTTNCDEENKVAVDRESMEDVDRDLQKNWIRIYNEAGKFYGVYSLQDTENRYKPVKLFL